MQKLSQKYSKQKYSNSLKRTEKNVKNRTKYLKLRDKAQRDKVGRELVRRHEKKQAKIPKTQGKTERRK
jgi:hypothetical protein